MQNWLSYLKQGLSRSLPKDRITGNNDHIRIKVALDRLRPFVGPQLPKFLLGFVIVIFTTLLSFPQPLITRYIVDDVILGRNLGLLIGAILLFVGIALIERLGQLLEDFYFARFEQEVRLNIQENLIERTFRLPISFFDDNQAGYLMTRLSNDVEELRLFFSGTIVYILSNVLRFLGGVAFLFYLEWRLATAVTITIPALAIFIYYFSDKIHILSHREMDQQADVAGRFQEFLSSASLVKAFSSEGKSTGLLMSDLRKAFQISMEQVTVSSAAEFVINLMPGIARVVVLAIGAYWIITGNWTLGSLLAFQAYLGYVFGPAQYLAATNLELQKALAALQRVSALLQVVPEDGINSTRKVTRLRGGVEFKNVSFSYDKKQKILDSISFQVQPGEKIAIVGPCGAGKTTLISLILRFYNPTGGEIYVDGEPVASYELASLRGRIGYVSQQTLLLSGTVKENLCFGNPSAGDHDIAMALKAAGCYDFVAHLPMGVETKIGENGIKLSEGQKQRLSLARALVKDPDILILDEPTSALDSLAEKSIFNSIPNVLQGKTMFIVAHRISTIREADRIFLLKENRLIAAGTHRSLVQTDDYYRSVVMYQQFASGR